MNEKLVHYLDFGATGMRVAPFALGTGQLGAVNGTVDSQLAQSLLHRYLDAGGNVVDTAEAYQGGRSEELIGETLRDRRDDVVLSAASRVRARDGTANVALAWLGAKGCLPVIGPRKVDDVKQLMAACALQLRKHHVRVLDETSAIRMGYPHELLATFARK